MIADPTTYSIADFIPFTADVYQRLIERQNEAFWPAHALAFLLGVRAMYLTWRCRVRSLGVLLFLVWVWVAITYFLRLFAELTFVGQFIGGAFLIQGAFMFGCAMLGGFNDQKLNHTAALRPRILGYVLAAFGLSVFPFFAPMLGRGWISAEWFAMTPNPTVLVTIGLLLATARPVWLWLLLPIPVLWCALSGALDWTFQQPTFWLLPAAAMLGIAAAIWKAVRSRKPGTHPGQRRAISTCAI